MLISLNVTFFRGPTNVDIFNEPEFEENPATDEIAKESQKIQKEIKTILSQVVINIFFPLIL